MAEVAMPTQPPSGLNGAAAADSPNNENAPSASSNAENITVFHDPENFNVKHPLQNSWTLWFTKPPSGKGDNWNDLLKEVVTFDTVEEFWGIYNNITACSDLAQKSDYHLFKQGVRPEWEDSQNKHGGKWSYSWRNKASVNIDQLWLHTQLAAIGETLEEDGDNEIMGVVVNVRKGFYRIGLWTRTIGKSKGGQGKPQEVLMKIGKNLKEVIQLPTQEELEFSGHADAQHAGSTRAKAKYTC